MERGKRYLEAKKKIDSTKLYEVREAIKIVEETKTAKFDETVEAAVKLGIDPRHADQQIRGAIVLPHGTGRSVRVLVFAKGDKVKEAQETGADYVGAEDLIEKISKKKRKTEKKNDKGGVIHTPVGKASFGSDKLRENFLVLMDTITRMKPSSSKGTFIKKVVLSTTMGPGIKVDPLSIRDELKGFEIAA